jgi:hypothetical protein
MIVIVTGGRDYDGKDVVHKALSDIAYASGGCFDLYQGGVQGADKLARMWAHDNMPKEFIHTFDADWDTHGRSAGPIRNQKMVDEAIKTGDELLVVAFPGGKGTSHCVAYAKSRGVKVKMFD